MRSAVTRCRRFRSEGCLGLMRPSVFSDARAQVGDALFGNADKHEEADGPEKLKARCDSLAPGWSWQILTRRELEAGAGTQCSDFALLISAGRLIYCFDFRV